MKKQSTSHLRSIKGSGQMRERDSDADWFPIEFLMYYDGNQIRAFSYVRRQDGSEILDGEYEVVDELGERKRHWKKRNGEWKVKWRHRWSKER